MKKIQIYAIILAVTAVICALAAVYQLHNPSRIIPDKEYTRAKAQLITANYFSYAEQNDIPKEKRAAKVYAVTVEFSTEQLEREYNITSVFFFVDVEGKSTVYYSNGTLAEKEQADPQASSELTQSVAALYNDTFTQAEDRDYGIPDYGEVKLYLRRGDGIYIKTYAADNMPDELSYFNGMLDDLIKKLK